MPSSNSQVLNDMTSVIKKINPKSILDLGTGFGKWGFLSRELLDLAPDKDKGYKDWSIIIDGVEIFEKYLTPVHRYIYNNVFIGNALDIIKKTSFRYDLIIAGDIIEHFTKQEGISLIQGCLKISKYLLISTPYIFMYQDDIFYNKFERHLSGWDIIDFKDLKANYVWTNGKMLYALFQDEKIKKDLAL